MPDPTPTPIMPLLNLYGWGGNYYGQFGNNTTVDLNVPTKLSEDTTWKFVFAGVGTSHGIKNDGTLWGWGRNTSGQVGNGQGGIYAQNLKVPVQIGSDNDWKLVSPGTQFTLAIKNNGTLWGWGLTEFGGAGNNYSPTQIGTDSDWKSVHGGYLGAHAIKNNGTLWGWGNNTWGTIGDGTFYLNGSIVRVTQVQIGSDIWKNISTGPNSDHKLAIKNDDTLWTWGGNSNGQLGDGNKTVPGPGGNFNKPYPIKVDNSSWISIATGIGHSLAVRSDGTLWSCGRNDYGQLGNGTTNESLHFIQIGSDSDWSSVYACAYTSFAMKSDGTFWSWGKNVFGETGDGTLPDVLPNPTRFAQIGSQFLQVYSGVFHCLALKEVVEPATTPTPTSTPTPTPTETPQPTPTATSCCGQDDKDWWTRCDSLILNGNFDYRVGNSGTFADTSDWTVQDVGFVGPPHGSNYIGSIYVNLNNSNTCTPGYIQQSFLTTIGQQYKLYFNMAASLDQFNFPEPHELKTFTVSVAGVTKNYAVDTAWQQSNTYQGMGWVSESLVFTAVDTMTVLRFESTYNGCFGPAVDRIEVCESNCLLSNGDFSLPSSPSGSCVGASGNDNRQGLLAAPPWYVFENCNVQSFYYCDNSKPYNRYVAMEIAQNGCFIEQIINTTPGQRYVCTFDMGASPGANILYQGQRAIEACVYDAAGYTSNTGLDPSQPIFQEIFLIDDVTTGNTYESLGWESKFFEFNATANTTLIRFRSPKHGTEVIHEAYSVIDNISVCSENTPTPTPTPTITIVPTITPTTTPTCNICFRMACDNVCPQATPTPTPTPTPDIFWPVEIHSPHISDYFSIPTDEEFWSNSLNNNNDDNSIYQIRKVSFDENNNKMYIASNTNLVFTVDLLSNAILNKFVVGTNSIVGIEVNPNNNYYYVLGSHLVAINPMDNTENILTYVGIGLDIKYEPINNRIYYLSKTDSNFTKLGYWNLSDNTDVTLETFEFSNGSIDAYVHKVCVSLTDLNKIAIVDLLSSNTDYIDVNQPKDLTLDTSGNIFLLNLNNITNIDNTNNISNIWQNEGLNNPTFIKININKNKIYIANKNNTITLHDSITGFYIMTSNMPTINGEFTDFKITNSGTLYGVYNNRVVIFNKLALP